MARATRSQKVEIAEDNFSRAVQIPLPSTPAQEQRVLADILHGPNSLPVLDDEAALEVKNLKAAYRAALGIGKRTRKAKNKRTEHQDLLPPKATTASEQQDIPSQASSSNPSTSSLLSIEGHAPSEERMQLRATRQQSKLQDEGQFGNEIQVYTQDQLAAQLPADLSYITSHFGGRSTGSPRLFIRRQNFGRSITNDHVALIKQQRAKVLEEEGNDIESDYSAARSTHPPMPEISVTTDLIETRASKSPSKLRTIEEIVEASAAQLPASPADGTIVDEEDSFCEQIISRSPAKPVTRIEDSVEALDQLEEALEALDQAALGKDVSTSAARNKEASTESEEQTGLTEHPRNTRKLQGPSSGYATVRIKSTAPKQVPAIKRAASMTFGRAGTDSPAVSKEKSRQHKTTLPSYITPKETVKSTKPLTRPTAFVLPGEAISQKLKEQREARRAQRESSEETQKDAVNTPRTRSTKPLTRPTFQLPGEAVSQKKREALEARWKAQEEEEKRRREFKARPLRLSTLPNTVPRETVASRARQNRIGNENPQEGKLDPLKGTSNIGAHRTSMAQLNLANVSAPRAPGPVPLARKPSITSNSSSSVPGHTQRTLSAHDVQIQRQRAKEIYNRDVFQTEDIERERKEREAAAKRAREEAAERGRQASREWAEKQRAKRMVEGDKGLSPRYGPGGQLGLQA